jgi:hypothetical protein
MRCAPPALRSAGFKQSRVKSAAAPPANVKEEQKRTRSFPLAIYSAEGATLQLAQRAAFLLL